MTIAPEENCSHCPLDDCPPPGEFPPGQWDNLPLPLSEIVHRTITREVNCPLEICPLTIKCFPKIIAPTLANSPERVLREN